MKLRKKETGEIGYFCFANWNDPVLIIMDKDGVQLAKYNSLAEMNKEWVDMPEEPKERWYINENGSVMKYVPFDPDGEDLSYMKYQNEIGNYFETKEEAELAVRKLKSWKRLKDKGFRFTLTPGVGSLDITPDKFQIEINADMPKKWFCCDAVQKDLDLLFGGEE